MIARVAPGTGGADVQGNEVIGLQQLDALGVGDHVVDQSDLRNF